MIWRVPRRHLPNIYMARKTYVYLVKPLVILTLLLISYILLNSLDTPFFYLPRLKTRDFLWRVKHSVSRTPKESKQIVLIAIDDKAYSQYGGRWPWEREAFAALIYNITRDKPNIIVINLAFLGRTERQEVDDFLLKVAFQDAGNVIGASYFEADGKYIVPNEYFRDALRDYGFTNKPVDVDKVIRYAKYFEPFRGPLPTASGILDYSLEIKLLCAYYNILPKDISYKNDRLALAKEGEKILEIPVDKNGYTFLNYTAKSDDLNIIPVLDVLGNKIPAGTFKDKIVLLGTTGKIFHEENSTPLGLFSGIEIIANSLIMILSHGYVYIAPYYVNLILFTLLIGLLTYFFWRFGVIKNILILLSSLILFFLISIFLAINNIIIDFFSMPTFCLLSYLAVEGTKYGTLIIEEIKLKNMAILDPTTELATRRYFVFRLDSDLRRAIRERRNLSVVLFSIDNLEQISSSLDIDKTDLLIKKIGQLIKKNSRKTRRGDFIARYGENIFGVILRETPLHGTIRYINRIKPILEHPQKIPTGDEIKPCISSGAISLDTVHAESASLFMKYGEASLNKAKEERDRVFIHDRKIEETELKEHEPGKPLDEIGLSFVAEELNGKNKELREMIKKLRTAYTEMAKTEKLSAMGKLASSIHHELNNPLSALRTCLQTVSKNLEQQPEVEPLQKTKGLIDSALQEVQHMIEMNKGLKDLYKPPKLTLERININKILNETMDFLKVELSKRKIELITRLKGDIPDIDGNKGDLKQAFLNIILNAIDAMPGGGKLTIETNTNERIEIKITDTGCGIPPENLDKIFTALFTTKEEGKGAGLGLYVTKQKIEQHNGTIKVSSQINQGTTFSILLPK